MRFTPVNSIPETEFTVQEMHLPGTHDGSKSIDSVWVHLVLVSDTWGWVLDVIRHRRGGRFSCQSGKDGVIDQGKV